jgi:hypothetical protein
MEEMEIKCIKKKRANFGLIENNLLRNRPFPL